MSALPYFSRTLPAVHDSRPAPLDMSAPVLHTAEGGLRLDTHRVVRAAPGYIDTPDIEADDELGVSAAAGALRVVLIAGAIGLALLGLASVIGGAR